MALYYNIETASGVFKVRNPMGRAGSLHFGIITKYMPANKKGENDPISPLEQERIGQGFEEWAAKVLPSLLVNYTPKGTDTPIEPITIDGVSGEDQYAIFLAICSTIEKSDNFFRIL